MRSPKGRAKTLEPEPPPWRWTVQTVLAGKVIFPDTECGTHMLVMRATSLPLTDTPMSSRQIAIAHLEDILAGSVVVNVPLPVVELMATSVSAGLKWVSAALFQNRP